MKKKQIIIITSVIVGVVLIGGITYAVSKSIKGATNAKKNNKVAVYTVQAAQPIYFEGEFQSARKVNFMPDMSKGTVDKVSVSDKQKVKEGEVLFTYKNSQVDTQKEALSDQLETLKSTYTKLKAQMDKPQESIPVVPNQVPSNNPGQAMPSISEADIKAQKDLMAKQAQQAKDQIQSQLDENLKQQKRMEKQISDLSSKSSYEVKAPFAGTVARSSDAANDPTKPVLTLISDNTQIVCNVSEKDVLKISENQDVSITIYGSGQVIKGKVKTINTEPSQGVIPQVGTNMMAQGASGSQTSSYTINIEPSSTEGILPGFHVQVSVKPEKELVKIPKTAIFKEGDKSFIWTVKDGVLKKTETETEEFNDKYLKVKNGVAADTKVVREPKNTMKEGDKVD
ncbi:HlyD family secretion protein [Clostridium cavendishii DSM 21758]|uniref:HlyD family secretion protein n=1 Tax=Clostridium cavendishii DSM 21758 TaxID=1121302 RepID=A0A1M6ECQ7_9CLOT|nr:HlyD family efflux transporter periplasmic adaptor subunit [Clostridium cavendishii]SHI83255.1 HlyD family secretion protein [Clostridium cavendishii DSM 21758]